MSRVASEENEVVQETMAFYSRSAEMPRATAASPTLGQLLKCVGDVRKEVTGDETPVHQVVEMSMEPRSLPFLLTFTNLTYSVKVDRKLSLFRRGDGGTKTLLNNISGEARDGEIMAVMGASGSGKSTLIDALANRMAKGSLKGSVTLNDEVLESRMLKVISAYVMQDDLLFPMLTVEETLMFAAEFRLPRNLSKSKKKLRVQTLVDQLGLRNAAKTVIGDEGHRGVSGGERRRVSIGIDIIHDPILLFLDEPTSGLDSTSAFMVVKVLQRIAQSGSVVIMSIHQPSYRILGLLDKMIFLSRGQTVYSGSPSNLPMFFSDFGHPIPDNENRTEFALDLIRELEGSPGGTKSLVEFNRSWQAFRRSSRNSEPVPDPNRPVRLSLKEAISASISRGKLVSGAGANDTSNPTSMVSTFANPLLVELAVLSNRSFTNSRRLPELFLVRLCAVVVTGVILATMFWRLDNSPKGVQERLGFFAFAMSTTFYTCADALPVFSKKAWNESATLKELNSGIGLHQKKMSWLRSAVNKAVEVGNKNNLTRAVRSYADSVVHHAGQAVAEGAKLIQDRIGGRNFKSFKQAVKRLEETSVSCRGAERTELMRRWLAILKEIESKIGTSSEDKEKLHEPNELPEESKESPRRQSMVLYYDSDMGGEPMTFRDVFLYSQALEGLSICMILEAPNEDDVPLLLDLFGLCLTGGKEVHNAIVSSIQDLAKVFSSYDDEVLVKREELLQFAEGAITGLKVNADIGRIDAEVSTLKKQLDGLKVSHRHVGDDRETNHEGDISLRIEGLKEALAHIRVCSRLEGLLLKKKALKHGDTAEIHAQKVDKLKVLSESLSSSSTKSEKRIADHRVQKEEALKFRVSKASEVSEIEKELAAEISGLEKQRNELEAELKKVNISLSAAQARFRNVMEERDKFFEANDQIVAHLKTKEEELSRSINSCQAEATVLVTWINFLEDAWSLQCSYTESKEKDTITELDRHEDYFTKLVIQLLSSYEKELRHPIDRIGKYVENLKTLTQGSVLSPDTETDNSKMLSPRRNLEEEYLDYEARIITTFSVVDNMREQFYAQQGKISSKENPEVKELFHNIEKLRQEFESIERPNLEIENPTHESDASPRDEFKENVPQPTDLTAEALETGDQKPSLKSEHVLDPEAELAKLESEFGNDHHDFSTEEIGEWEFDELERELRSGDSSGK
ncbi:filamin A-interacting protein 1-like [Dorcoceras hygrometricum]|uniref:Filamin A-interacting protein 1-like n=1 Tax=Dorcoceras hygrometricum TaxID=472368 RepID=A0A2Z7B3I1_9LAMI|nr:filamin A-interacting protein 1-like [Dorcoceras hygrometricum]